MDEDDFNKLKILANQSYEFEEYDSEEEEISRYDVF